MTLPPPPYTLHTATPSLRPIEIQALARGGRPPPRPRLIPVVAFQKFLPLALNLAPEQVKDFKGVDLTLVHPNVRIGLRSITPHLAHVRKELPTMPLDAVLALPSLCAGLLHAHTLVITPKGVTREDLDARYAQLQEARLPLLHQAQTFKYLGTFPAERVDKLAAGGGMFKHALSVIGLHALFHEHREEIAQKHPFSDAMLNAAADHGLWLIEHVTPTGARTEEPEESDTRDLRNRFWTLITERHALLRRIGYQLFPEAMIDAKVPALQSRLAPGAHTEEEDLAEERDEHDTPAPDTKPA
jgi:hypothetical protein